MLCRICLFSLSSCSAQLFYDMSMNARYRKSADILIQFTFELKPHCVFYVFFLVLRFLHVCWFILICVLSLQLYITAISSISSIFVAIIASTPMKIA